MEMHCTKLWILSLVLSQNLIMASPEREIVIGLGFGLAKPPGFSADRDANYRKRTQMNFNVGKNKRNLSVLLYSAVAG